MWKEPPASATPAAALQEPTSALPYELNPGPNRGQLSTITYSSPQDTRIEVFWKDFRGLTSVDARLQDGIGPVISVIVVGREVLRFDCLGTSGHYHAVLVRPDPTAEIRIWFREQDLAEQVERSFFEIERNLDYYLKRNPLAEVRCAKIAADEHRTRCAEAREAAHEKLRQNVSPVTGGL